MKYIRLFYKELIEIIQIIKNAKFPIVKRKNCIQSNLYKRKTNGFFTYGKYFQLH